MAKTIDPAFQAAPVLAQTSHDPLEFSRRHNLQKFQVQRRRQEEQERNTAIGLHDLMLDLKGWEDQDGFRELMADQDKVMNGFLELSRKGMNLVSPKTTEEIMAYKAINDAHEVIKQKADTWATQKGVYDVLIKGIEADSKLPEDDRKIDAEATMGNIKKFLQSKSIFERGSGLAGLMVTKPDIEDVRKYIGDIKGSAPKLDVKSWPGTDENGQAVNYTSVVQDPKKQKEIEDFYRNQYKLSTTGIKNGVKRVWERNKQSFPEGWTEEDAFIGMADQNYQQKFLGRAVGKGGGIEFSFLGQKMRTSPGTARKEPLPYGDRTYTSIYEFAAMKPVTIPIGATGTTKFQGETWVPLGEGVGGTVEGVLDYVDIERKELIFKVSKNSTTPRVYTGNTIAVPLSVIGDKANDLPIVLPDGKTGKLKDIFPSEKPASQLKTIGNKDFSKIIPPLLKRPK